MQRGECTEDCEVVLDFRDRALQDVGAKLGRTYGTTKDFEAMSAPRDQITIGHPDKLSIAAPTEGIEGGGHQVAHLVCRGIAPFGDVHL